MFFSVKILATEKNLKINGTAINREYVEFVIFIKVYGKIIFWGEEPIWNTVVVVTADLKSYRMAISGNRH